MRRAAFVAAFNGWTIAACAILSLVVGLSTMSLGGFAVGVGIAAALGAFAFIELRGRERLLQFDPSACRMLGWNQLAFMTLIVAYCAISLVDVYRHPDFTMEYTDEFQQFISRDDWDLFVEVIFQPYWPAIWKATYFSVIAATLLAQGGNALYYFTRRRHLLAHLSAQGSSGTRQNSTAAQAG